MTRSHSVHATGTFMRHVACVEAWPARNCWMGMHRLHVALQAGEERSVVQSSQHGADRCMHDVGGMSSSGQRSLPGVCMWPVWRLICCKTRERQSMRNQCRSVEQVWNQTFRMMSCPVPSVPTFGNDLPPVASTTLEQAWVLPSARCMIQPSEDALTSGSASVFVATGSRSHTSASY